MVGRGLPEIRELVELATRCNEVEIVPSLEEVLETKLKETERKMAELSAFRQNLFYYRERASVLSGGVLPTDRYCEDVSFCGCLEAVTGKVVRSCEGRARLRMLRAALRGVRL